MLITCLGVIAGVVSALSTGEVAEEMEILSELSALNPVDLLQSSCDAQANKEHTLALELLSAAKASAEKRKNKVLLAYIHIQLSDLYLTVGQRNEAESFGYEALEMASGLDNLQLMACSLNNWGNVLIQYDGYTEAIDAYDESFLLSMDAGDPEGALHALANMMRVSLLIDDLDLAYRAFSEAKPLLTELYDEKALPLQMQFASQVQVLMHDLIVAVQEPLNDWAAATWQQIATTAKQQGDQELECRAYGNLGVVHENKEDDTAIHFTRWL